MSPGILEAPHAGANGVSNGSSGSTVDDVLVVGAGPAGLMLAANLVRFGLKTRIIDNRPDATSTGRADGIQPKSIETLRQMRLADSLLQKGVRIYDIAFWKSTLTKSMHRTGREIHYPPVVDLLDPYILLVHQGMVEGVFIDDLKEREVEVQRNTSFTTFEYSKDSNAPLLANCEISPDKSESNIEAKYLVGCDGAHSKVRKALPYVEAVGASRDAIWGVLDGVLDTDFPDIWSKVVVHSDKLGSVLMIPRERNMTRLYIELKSDTEESIPQEKLTQEFVMKRAQEIMDPYYVRWLSVEWFGRYQIGQRVANKFTDHNERVFITGDASHTHSPKAAQGMNTSIHDSWNLAWKLNLSVRGLAKPSLLNTYEHERRKIAQDLINFDYEHANAFAAGDSDALAKNFQTNVAFISGVGATYGQNILNVPLKGGDRGNLRPGCLLPPAKATRFIDANPIDIQSDIPALGQFRIYFLTHNVHAAKPFLDAISSAHQSSDSYVGRVIAAGNASYEAKPVPLAHSDEFVCPWRYTSVSPIFTYSLITDMNRNGIEIQDLPEVLKKSSWTFYLDDIPEKDTRRQSCIDKWMGGLLAEEVAVVNVRPDGYVGSICRWADGSRESGLNAAQWLDEYYSAFLVDA